MPPVPACKVPACKVFLMLAITCCAQTTRSSEVDPEALNEVRSKVREAVSTERVAGATVLICVDGKTVCFESEGCCDIEDSKPLQADSIFRIYSMTKPITSVAAMTLYEQGKFDLDDAVGKYIPSFQKTNVMQGDGDERKLVPANRPITVRDLLRHTSGYSYGPSAPGPMKDAYSRSRMQYRAPHSMMPPDMSIADAANALATVPAHHHPGERFTYGFNTDILGRLIEVWSEMPLDEYLEQAILRPLKMNDTGFVVEERNTNRFASCHTKQNGQLTIADKADSSPFTAGFKFLSGGGGLVSTARDYANFCQMLIDGGKFEGTQVLQPETVELMFTNQLGEASGDFQFGLGFAINDVQVGSGDSARTVKQYSWAGYASTDFRIVPEENLIQIVLRQHVPTDPSLANEIFPIVYGGLQ